MNAFSVQSSFKRRLLNKLDHQLLKNCRELILCAVLLKELLHQQQYVSMAIRLKSPKSISSVCVSVVIRLKSPNSVCVSVVIRPKSPNSVSVAIRLKSPNSVCPRGDPSQKP